MSFTPRPGQVSGFAGPNVVNNSYLARHIQQIGPMTAGFAIQAATGLRNQPHRPMGGPGILAAAAAELSC
jgi:hypothetical protein